MSEAIMWRLLFVDDDEEICDQAREFFEGESIDNTTNAPQIVTANDFAMALKYLEAQKFDLLVLDVRLGAHDEEVQKEEAGVQTLRAIKERRFVPVVFFTGLPNLVRHMETSLVQVVEKTEGLPQLLATIQSIFATKIPAVNRAIIHHLENVQREYMWNFVANHWENFDGASDYMALAFLLARRLAMSFSSSGIQQLAKELGGQDTDVMKERIHPMQYYILPPVNLDPLAGDLFRGEIEGQEGYWILLTPSCDLVNGREKADRVILAQCLPLDQQVEYKERDESNTKKKSFEALLKNNRKNAQSERYYYLPSALTLLDLVVDFQQLVSLPREQMNSLERLASLDSPFSEALLTRFVRYFGRLGTPDLDLELIMNRFTSKK